ncbi:MAG TPA: NADP-dependent oxidoreductase [Acidobacteriaceae bacterium]|nr:NADP-dependent oxidoreductase [Acidobacteriaceae bacterium]
MKAVQLHGYGSVDRLAYEDVPTPVAGAGQVLVKLTSTSVNPIDYKIRRGDMKQIMPFELPTILGYDLAGQVGAIGEGVTGIQTGAFVMGVTDHTYAEYVACKPEILAPIPQGLNPSEAGAFPLVLQTGAQLIELGVESLTSGRLLITGALGSVGRVAAHIAKQRGLTVILGVRERQRGDAEKLGAYEIVALDDAKQMQAMKELDAVADTIGPPVIDQLLPHIRKSGILATVVGKPKSAEGRDLVVNEVWSQPDAKRLAQLARVVAKGELAIPIAARLKLAEIRKAHEVAEKGAPGKVLLVP